MSNQINGILLMVLGVILAVLYFALPASDVHLLGSNYSHYNLRCIHLPEKITIFQ